MKKNIKCGVIKNLFLRAEIFCLVVFFVSGSRFLFGQSAFSKVASGDAGFAEQEFRRGVQAYYRCAFNDSIMQFEKALSYLPNENLILEWLGKAYYRSGIEGAAIDQWQFASDSGYGGLLLKNRIEVVQERRITGAKQESALRYTEAGGYSGKNGEILVFSQPVSVLPNPDGTMWILSYGSNDLLCMDVNGKVIERITGPINGFDRPVDIIRLENEKLLVSES